MTTPPGWEAPITGRRVPRWVWALLAVAALVVVTQLARTPDEALPGLPVDVVEEPTGPEPVPPGRDVPDPSDRWEPVPPPPIGIDSRATGVWTGDELLVWSGEQIAAWSPASRTWHLRAHAPVVWASVAFGLWTGEEALFLGVPEGTGDLHLLVYRPADDRWRSPGTGFGPGPVPEAVGWDGQRLHVWTAASATAVDLSTWDAQQIPGLPLRPRRGTIAHWLSEAGELFVSRSAAYRPADGTWRAVPQAPWSFTLDPATTSDGRRKVYSWGLPAEGLQLPSGMVYDAVDDAWAPLPDLLAQERAGASATVTDDGLLLVWGGLDRRLREVRLDGFVLRLGTERWRQLPPAPLSERQGALLAWVDGPDAQGLLVWGGRWEDTVHGDGAFYPGPLFTDAMLGLPEPRPGEE